MQLQTFLTFLSCSLFLDVLTSSSLFLDVLTSSSSFLDGFTSSSLVLDTFTPSSPFLDGFTPYHFWIVFAVTFVIFDIWFNLLGFFCPWYFHSVPLFAYINFFCQYYTLVLLCSLSFRFFCQSYTATRPSFWSTCLPPILHLIMSLLDPPSDWFALLLPVPFGLNVFVLGFVNCI